MVASHALSVDSSAGFFAHKPSCLFTKLLGFNCHNLKLEADLYSQRWSVNDGEYYIKLFPYNDYVALEG